jgi:serine phosphatase RsbU (regulator of sigma subunit)
MPLPELGEELRCLLEAHRGEEPQRDDITLLALRI